MSVNFQNQITSPKKSHIINYTTLQGKTRVESLIDRIQSANKEINSILEKPEEKNISEKKEINIPKQSENLKTLNEKITDNNKSVQVGLDDNINNNETNIENQEIKENKENNENQEINKNNKEEEPNKKDNNNLDIDIPFIKKTKSLLNELQKLKENGGATEDDINKEISELPKRAIVEMSLSDFKIKKQYETIKKELEEKNTYIKKLENEIVNQRIINNNLKKSEGENLLKISALEDELRVMKLKLLGYNTSEYNTHHNHQKFNTDANNCGHVYGENLIHSMWVRDNLNNKQLNNFDIENNGKPVLNKGERWEAPWISQSVGNMNRMLRNANMNRINKSSDIGQFRTEHKFNNDFGEKKIFENNERYNNFRMNYNGGNSNFQRVSGMILGSPTRLTKNFSNDFNRFRMGNNNYMNINNNNQF